MSRSYLDLKQSLYGLAIDASQTRVAVACKNDVQLLRLQRSSSGFSFSPVGSVQMAHQGIDFVMVRTACVHTV
jgi:hypothetical protein